jgi:hypothetical protein
MAQTAKPVQLKPETVEAFETYVRQAEATMDRTLHGGGPFLWADETPARAQQLQEGQIAAQLWSGKHPVAVPHGLIHDWVGAVLIPEMTVKKVLALVQNYDNHKNIYKPEVIDSVLVSQQGNDFRIFLRLLKKKIITVVLDTDHEVHYQCLDRRRWVCRSYTTRISEVEDAGTPKERIEPPDSGYGFLWRLYSYWRFEEKNDGVYMECRALSLTRDIPFGLRWIIEPMVQRLPRESLIQTLEATRQGVLQRFR